MRRKARSGAALHSQEKLSGGDNASFAGSRELDALEDPWSGTAKIAH